ncbi:hypothetical protein, conserved [Eimeria praecox]|uniref:Uncharacterized protein n=1 Tax=Eimeria praecox TaxID=51316 RepID=U6GEM3_9EIME|nr:hypothetical protein, conserved [Eimeria praecox]
MMKKEGGVLGLQSERLSREEAVDDKKRRINAGDSDDEFEDANWDTVGFDASTEDSHIHIKTCRLLACYDSREKFTLEFNNTERHYKGQEFPFGRIDAELREL